MNKYEKAAATAVASMLVAGAAIFLYAPTDALQGPVQRIFYLHVSAAIGAYGCFAVVLVGGAIYLRNGSLVADRFARAGALVGLVFTTVTLVMGMLWAKPIWGTYWTWDARLTSTLVLWIIYAVYLLVRRLAEPGRQAARFAAVVGIFGFIDVPIVHFSVTWWQTVHPTDHRQRRAPAGDARDIFLHHGLHAGAGRGDGRDPVPDRDARGRRGAAADRTRTHRQLARARGGAGQMSYLVIAYAFAVLVLGGYLVWSLRRLRQLEEGRRSER